MGDYIDITYHFETVNLEEFNPKIRIPINSIKINYNKDYLDYLIFQVGLIELISYVKATCSKNIIIEAGYINDEQINFYQKRNNNTGKNMNKKEEEKKNEFDHENFNKLKTDDEKRDFLGEKLFNLIQENKITKEKNGNEDEVGRITGMILAIPNMNEIIEILESPSKLEERINEAYDLIEKSK